MKKLMIAAAIVCAAAMSQAASVTWGNSSTAKVYGLDGTTPVSSLTIGLYLVGGGDDGSDKLVASGAAIGMTAGVMGTSKWSYTYGSDASNGDKFYALATLTSGGKDYQMIIDPGWTLTAVNNSGVESFTWAAGTYGGLGVEGDKGKWVAQSVPEPTSGLLLLLGMAGLALRRRRA